MTNILEQYYQGIAKQLQGEVNNINALFEHQATKGAGNEMALRNLVTSFLPQGYGVGSGTVIDSTGKQSRQCDVIIYERLRYPAVLSLTNVHMFPVDLVYATVEVKTTLNASEVDRALENIASVRRLKILDGPFFVGRSVGAGYDLGPVDPTPPIGMIFAYQSDAVQFETFQAWFHPKSAQAAGEFPSLVGCLDQGLAAVTPADRPCPTEEPFNPWAERSDLIPVVVERSDGGLSYVTGANLGARSAVYEGVSFPTKQLRGDSFLIDQSRVLLLFLLSMSDILATKHVRPDISFLRSYLPASAKRIIPGHIPDGGATT